VKAYTFAEICLSKGCFRVMRVVAKDEGQARRTIYGGDWGWGLLGESETKSRKRGTKTRLIRTRENFSEFVEQFGLIRFSAESAVSRAQAMTTSSFVRGCT
jgi:hypothetical protein